LRHAPAVLYNYILLRVPMQNVPPQRPFSLV